MIESFGARLELLDEINAIQDAVKRTEDRAAERQQHLPAAAVRQP